MRGALAGETNCFASELVLREALTNAVVHGSRGDPAKQVRCVARIKRRRLLLVIEDQGEGFDWRAARSEVSAPTGDSGRGCEILRTYARRVRYNAKGNAVAILQNL